MKRNMFSVVLLAMVALLGACSAKNVKDAEESKYTVYSGVTGDLLKKLHEKFLTVEGLKDKTILEKYAYSSEPESTPFVMVQYTFSDSGGTITEPKEYISMMAWKKKDEYHFDNMKVHNLEKIGKISYIASKQNLFYKDSTESVEAYTDLLKIVNDLADYKLVKSQDDKYKFNKVTKYEFKCISVADSYEEEGVRKLVLGAKNEGELAENTVTLKAYK